MVTRDPHQYEHIIDEMTGGGKRCGFSGAPNAWLGPREMARCAVDAAAGMGQPGRRHGPAGTRHTAGQR